jgi:hypothetical protein
MNLADSSCLVARAELSGVTRTQNARRFPATRLSHRRFFTRPFADYHAKCRA